MFSGLGREDAYSSTIANVLNPECEKWAVHVCRPVFSSEDVRLLKSASRQFSGSFMREVRSAGLRTSQTRSLRPIRNSRGMITIQYVNCKSFCFDRNLDARNFSSFLSRTFPGRFNLSVIRPGSTEHDDPGHLRDPPYFQELQELPPHLQGALADARHDAVHGSTSDSSSEDDSSSSSDDLSDESSNENLGDYFFGTSDEEEGPYTSDEDDEDEDEDEDEKDDAY
jgi:hypothetical protein